MSMGALRGFFLSSVFLSQILLISQLGFALPKIFTLDTSKHGQRVMLDSFESENRDDIPLVLEQLEERFERIQEEHKGQLELKLHIDESLRAKFESEDHLLAFVEQLKELAPVTITYDKVPKHPLRKAYRGLQNIFMNNYRWAFTLVRGLALGTASMLSLKISQGLPWEIAIGAGALTGFLSANVQYWSEYIYTWMDTTSKIGKKLGSGISNFLEKFGLKRSTNKQRFGVELMAWLERFGKWAGMEVLFVGVLCAGMKALGVDQDCSPETVLSTATLATIAQGTWDFAVTTTKNLKLLRGEREKDVQFFSSLSFLSVATVTTGVLTILKLMQVPHAEWAFLAVGATGAATLFKAAKAKAIEVKKNAAEGPENRCEVELLIREAG